MSSQVDRPSVFLPRQACFQMGLGSPIRRRRSARWQGWPGAVCTVCPLSVSMESRGASPCVLSTRHVENKLEEEAQKVC